MDDEFRAVIWPVLSANLVINDDLGKLYWRRFGRHYSFQMTFPLRMTQISNLRNQISMTRLFMKYVLLRNNESFYEFIGKQ